MLVNVMLFLCVCGGLVGLLLMLSSFLSHTVETVPRTRDDYRDEPKGFANPSLDTSVETILGPQQINWISKEELIQQYPIISGGPYNLSNATLGLKPGDQYSNSNGTFTVPHQDQGTLLYNPKTDEVVLFVETEDLFHGTIIYPEGEYLTWKTLEVLLDEGYQLVGEI